MTTQQKRTDGAGTETRDMAKAEKSSQERGSMAPLSPGEPFQQLRREFDRLFDQFFPSGSGRLSDFDRSGLWGLDLDERDDAVVVRAEAPGFEPGEFDLKVRGNQLVLCACHEERSGEKKAPTRHWQKQELCRTVMLPAEVNAEKVDASYRNGVLTITLPKATPTSSRRIAVHG